MNVHTSELTFNERELAGDFLGQAIDGFLEIGQIGDQHASAPQPETHVRPTQTMQEIAMATFMKRRQMLASRLSAARNSTLFAAIAVEAAVNYYIAARLRKTDHELVDKLSIEQKLLIVPRLAGRGELFASDAEPYGTVRQLFKLRNRIAHPKVGSKSVAEFDSEDFTPAKVCTHLVGAARAIAILHDDLGPEGSDSIAHIVLKTQDELRSYARTWADPPTAPDETLRRLLAEKS